MKATVLVLSASLLCGFPLTSFADPAATPATQPSTQPAWDVQKAQAMMEAAGGIYTSIHEAFEKGDLETAAMLSKDLLEQADEIKASVQGSILQVPVNMGITQLRRLHEALEAKDAEKAKTIMDGLDNLGQSISRVMNQQQAPTTAPADGANGGK